MNNIQILSSISNNTKYLKWYLSLIYKEYQLDVYSEKHHILPRSLGGDNSKNNIVNIPARVHFICHKLLVKMLIDSKHRKCMIHALNMLAKANNGNQSRYKITSSEYQQIKELLSNSMKGENNPNYGKPAHNRGKTHTPETRQKLSEANKNWNTKNPGKRKGKVVSEETKERMRHPKSEAGRENIRSAAKNKEKFKCTYCGILCIKGNLIRWHEENCLLAPNGKENRSKWINPNIGQKRSKETRENISSSKKGIKHTEETKIKIRNARKGIPVPDDVLAKRVGKKRSAETRDKISKALAGKPKTEEHKANLRKPKNNKGHCPLLLC